MWGKMFSSAHPVVYWPVLEVVGVLVVHVLFEVTGHLRFVLGALNATVAAG